MHVQIARNSILQKEVKNIEEQIKEIKSLKHMRDTLISKMVAIQSVLMSQVFVVHLFDELIKIMPIGVYLTKMEKQSNSISLWGWAQSYTHISLLMVKIEHNSWMQSPVLNEIKKLSDKKQQYSNAFKVSFVLKPKNQAEF
jgi:type IV pilus assembly protein PilN